ncbi:TolC family protein [Balneolales bacterium ANBcel1]|nr:TolC family protein [Balneolales bacterium ANBcel1]
MTVMIIAMVALAGSSARAQDHPEQQIGPSPHPQLEEYLRIAAEENPELRALWHRYRSEQEKVFQVGALPDPEVSIGYDFNPMMSETVLGRFSISAMQMFPWFGTLESRREMQRASSEADLQQLNSRQLELYRDIRTVWFELSELQRQIEIAEETIGLVRDLETLVEVRYETARTGQADLLRIQMEEQRLQTMIANLTDRKNPLRARFNSLLNRDSDAVVRTASEIGSRPLPYTEEALKARLLEQNPRFDQLDARERMLREQQNQARLDGRPSFGLGLEVMGRDFGPMSMDPDMKEGFVGMATIRVPLYRSRYSAQNRQATEQLQGLDYERIHTKNTLLTELEESLERYRESGRSIRLLTDELIPRAEQAYAILGDEYAAGNARFDEVLQMQRELLDLELQRIEALVRQNKAVIRIESITENERITSFNTTSQ